jgi:hypothetical protein
MYAIHESREFSSMRRRRRRLTLSAIFASLCAAPDAAAVSLTEEADKLEAQYGDAAIAIIREKVQGADRKARKKLYRLHDELARRRRGDEPDEFAGLMA